MNLECNTCAAEYEDRWRCECGGTLVFSERALPDSTPPDPTAFDGRNGLWSFRDFLPVGTTEGDRISLGEGMTPLVQAPTWAAQFKLEYVSPTGSFKDRGATTTITRAREQNVGHVIEDSSGNAGLAIATYAARAGIPATIFVPDQASAVKRSLIRRTGATVVPVRGSRAAVTEACLAALDASAGWYASHVWNPAFLAGTKTTAFEIALQYDWNVPDAVVAPVGHGTLLLGLAAGFEELIRAGWIDRRPRLLAVQASGMSPLVDALSDETTAGRPRNELADGVQIRSPPRLEEMMDVMETFGGSAVAIDEPTLAHHHEALLHGGFTVEPTAALGPAACQAFRDDGVIDDTDEIVVVLTGANGAIGVDESI